MAAWAVDAQEMNHRRTVEPMLLRPPRRPRGRRQPGRGRRLRRRAAGRVGRQPLGQHERDPGQRPAVPDVRRARRLLHRRARRAADRAGDRLPAVERQLREPGRRPARVRLRRRQLLRREHVSLVGAQQPADHVYPPQFAALSAETSLVTLGIGGNDLELFQTMVGTCGQLGLSEPDGSPCRDYMADAGQEEGPAAREDRQDRRAGQGRRSRASTTEHRRRGWCWSATRSPSRPRGPAGSCRSPRATTPTCVGSRSSSTTRCGRRPRRPRPASSTC